MNEDHADTCTHDELVKARIIDKELAQANFEVHDADDLPRS
jgi:hypothetical protein